MADIVNDMFPKNIYELYNERLVSDQAFVDTIVTSIKFQIYYHISEGLEYKFLYDADEWMENQEILQKLRVMDQVIKFFRSRGIRCSINNTLTFNLDPYIFPLNGFNSPTAPSTILKIEWIVRNGQEYMKAYV